jgi:hypothetical protein
VETIGVAASGRRHVESVFSETLVDVVDSIFALDEEAEPVRDLLDALPRETYRAGDLGRVRGSVLDDASTCQRRS